MTPITSPTVGDIWSNEYFTTDRYYFLIVEDINKKHCYFNLLNLHTGKIGIHQVKDSFWRYES